MANGHIYIYIYIYIYICTNMTILLIWRRNPEIRRSDLSKSLDFREQFGCALIVVHMVWSLLESRKLIQKEGRIHHLLWALSFMKTYDKENTMCNLIYIRDSKTFRKWAWLFIDSIAELESSVVSIFFLIIWRSNIHFILPSSFRKRFFLKDVWKEIGITTI